MSETKPSVIRKKFTAASVRCVRAVQRLEPDAAYRHAKAAAHGVRVWMRMLGQEVPR